jgi:hypothetical protein
LSNKIKKPKKGGQGPAWAVKATDNDDDPFQYYPRMYMYMCMYVFIYVRTYVCMYVRTYVGLCMLA